MPESQLKVSKHTHRHNMPSYPNFPKTYKTKHTFSTNVIIRHRCCALKPGEHLHNVSSFKI
jgi:hypothetical protein